MKVEILDEAEQDLVDGYRFYESQSRGVGTRYLISLFSAIDSLASNAGIHPARFGYHRLLAQRFPYAVYYRVDGDVVRVYPVLDCRRDPSGIRARLT